LKGMTMHEMAVADGIIKIIEEKLKEEDPQAEVSRVDLKIGKLTCVEPEALRLSFEILTRETPLRNASLHIKSIPITGKCKDCRRNLKLNRLDFACPFCGSFRIDIKTGRELSLESFEIE
jgi:hydrogenase nickel incorporation protein HypA/HybF